MDKQLIERLALESSQGIHVPLAAECITYFVPGDLAIQLCNRFLSAVDAERGKYAFGYISRHAYSWSKEDGWVSIGAEIRKERQQDDDVALFLAPQIPEGMVLVKIEDLERARDNLIDGDYESARRDLYCLIAAAGVAP